MIALLDEVRRRLAEGGRIDPAAVLVPAGGAVLRDACRQHAEALPRRGNTADTPHPAKPTR